MSRAMSPIAGAGVVAESTRVATGLGLAGATATAAGAAAGVGAGGLAYPASTMGCNTRSRASTQAFGTPASRSGRVKGRSVEGTR